jgi:hypothetical protein
MVFAEDGELYVTDNDFEENGDPAIANDPDWVWRIDACCSSSSGAPSRR